MRIGIVAGEASGDLLGAGLIRALEARVGALSVFGVAGPRMRQAGCEAWEDSEALAVMGLAEVARHLPRLIKLRRRLAARFIAAAPDVFVGIDAPDFNLGLELKLRRQSLRTVHYVSPSVWAWRRGRMKKIRRATDCVLCLLPFEQAFYRAEGHPAVFTGHPLADDIALDNPPQPARAALGFAGEDTVLAVLPGSRQGEVARIGPVFAAAVALLAASRPDLRFIAPMASAATRESFEAQLAAHAPGIPVMLTVGNAQQAMIASDAVLLASGTAVLEALLTGRPHVVAYRVAPLTAGLVRTLGLMHTPYYSLTNLLAGRPLIPEFMQSEARPEALAEAVLKQLSERRHADELREAFAGIHRTLRRGASARAAEAVMDIAGAMT